MNVFIEMIKIYFREERQKRKKLQYFTKGLIFGGRNKNCNSFVFDEKVHWAKTSPSKQDDFPHAKYVLYRFGFMNAILSSSFPDCT